MVFELPRCGECGASARDRDDAECPYCGTILPWELWDEVSSRRIELVEADAPSFEAALLRIERSDEYQGEVVREARKRRRLMPRRPRETDRRSNVEPWLALVAVVLAPIMLLVGYSLLRFAGALLALFALLATVGVLNRRQFLRAEARYREKRRRYHSQGRVQHLAAGVLEISVPKTVGGGADRRTARTVVLQASSGKQHACVVEPDSELTAGDIGVARIRGLELEEFQVLDRVEVPGLR